MITKVSERSIEMVTGPEPKVAEEAEAVGEEAEVNHAVEEMELKIKHQRCRN